jgi:DNA-binding NtrC family response regulator
VAAFEVGRLHNHLSFHLQHVWFFHGYHVRAAEETGRRLRRVQTLLMPVPERAQAAREISDHIDGLIGLSNSPDHWDDLTRINCYLHERNFPDDLTATPLWQRGQLLEPVFDALRELRRPVLCHLSDQMHLALQLGECIDQGLCPPAVYRHFDAPAGGDKRARRTGERPETIADPPQTACSAASRPAGGPSLLAPRAFRPGELPPPDGWLDDVRQLWATLQMPVPCPAVPSHQTGMGVDGAPGIVSGCNVIDQLVRAAHDGLRALARPGANPAVAPGEVSSPAQGPDATEDPPPPRTQARPECASPPAVRAPEGAQRVRQLLLLKKRMDPEGRYIGESLPLLRVFEEIDTHYNSPDDPVLLLGPSGAGKTEIAEVIHRSSPRKDKPFRREQAADNKGADLNIPKGRWAGFGENSGLNNIPKEGIKGILHECAGGTIFVDELAEVGGDFQTFLLDVIDQRDIPPVSGTGNPVKHDVRLIFATNADPDDAVRAGKLRPDLLRRLNSGIIRIPALAERRSDIFLFARAFCKGRWLEPRCLLALLRYAWPGQVGELRAVLGVAMGRAANEKAPITLDLIRIREQSICEAVARMSEDEVSRELYAQLIAMLREQGLEKGKGLQRRMSELLNESQSTISRRMKALDPGP